MITLKVSKIPVGHVAEMQPGKDKFYVLRDGVLHPARLDCPIARDEKELLSTPGGVPEGRFMPTLFVKTDYCVMFGVRADALYAEDYEDGEEMPLVQTVGSSVTLSIYTPGLTDGRDVEVRIRKALSNEFGKGLAFLRAIHSQPVSEKGLPPVLGNLTGELGEIL